jgi:fructose 5-dehydrogenase small subunit
MSHSYRDDAPADFSLFRRRIVIAGGVVLGGFAVAPTFPLATTDTATAAPPDPFMELSSLLIPHRLDRDVGLRLAKALSAKDPTFAGHVTALLEIAKKKQAAVVEDFFPDVPEGSLKDAALLIISAWYLGVIVDAPDAEVYSYELALMFQPTIDVMTIPSYAISGPNGWTSEAPPLSNMPKF